MRPLWLVLVASSLALFPGAAQARRVVYAITLGNNAPPAEHPELANLRYADDDAARFHRVLAQDESRSALLTVFDAETRTRYAALSQRALAPSFENLRSTLVRFGSSMRAESARGNQPILFVTFSGHGATDAKGEPALALSDGLLNRTRLYDELLPLVSEAEVHIIVDACRAAGAIGLRGAFGLELEGQTVALSPLERSQLLATTTLARFSNVGALAATTVDQDAHEWSHLESGVFTHEILSALRGAADINRDGKIFYSEVQAFVAAANRDIKNPKARATVLARPPGQSGDGVLLELRDLTGTRLVQGAGKNLGHFFVELENGERALDAHLSEDAVVTLALPANESGHLRTQSQEAHFEAGTTPLSLAGLRFERSTVTARGSIEASLRSQLWQSDYGPLYYRGFVDSQGLPGVSFEAAQSTATPRRHVETSLVRKRAAWTCAVVGGAALAAAATTLGLAISDKRAFEQTDEERRAHELSERYQRRMIAAVVSSAVAVSAGAVSFLLWPRVEKSAGQTRAGVEAQFRF